VGETRRVFREALEDDAASVGVHGNALRPVQIAGARPGLSQRAEQLTGKRDTAYVAALAVQEVEDVVVDGNLHHDTERRRHVLVGDIDEKLRLVRRDGIIPARMAGDRECGQEERSNGPADACGQS